MMALSKILVHYTKRNVSYPRQSVWHHCTSIECDSLEPFLHGSDGQIFL